MLSSWFFPEHHPANFLISSRSEVSLIADDSVLSSGNLTRRMLNAEPWGALVLGSHVAEVSLLDLTVCRGGSPIFICRVVLKPGELSLPTAILIGFLLLPRCVRAEWRAVEMATSVDLLAADAHWLVVQPGWHVVFDVQENQDLKAIHNCHVCVSARGQFIKCGSERRAAWLICCFRVDF